MAKTPPLRTSVHTPPTPLHGAKYDHYQHSTRRSTRPTITRSLRALETPPPNLDDVSYDSASLDPKKPTILRCAAHTCSPPSSTPTSPRKKPSKSRSSNRGIERMARNGHNSAIEALTIDPVAPSDKNPSSHQTTLKAATNMLPTPAKTPRKKLVQPSAVANAARVLFPVHAGEDSMPTPRKRRNKRHVGFSLYNSVEDEEDANSAGEIPIYTDSKDKVPELDPTEDNPFYEQPKQHDPPPEPLKRRISKKRKVSPTTEESEKIKEAFKREEGMVYVFRGKKIFRKFPNDGDNLDKEGGNSLDSDNVRPLTRSSIKPRLLFPTQKQRQERDLPSIDDEEAPTDIEEPHGNVAPAKEEQHVTTPTKLTIFSPPTPPTTGRATRSSKKRTPEQVEAIPYEGKKVSPFDGWARTKVNAGLTPVAGEKGKKREVEAMGKADSARGSKRIKSNSVT